MEGRINACARYTSILITLNNYTEDEYLHLLNHEAFKYIIIGKEIAPTTGTPHIHAYIELFKQTRFNKIKKINNRMDFRARRGTQKQCIDYVKKNGDYEERGEMNRQGERVDLRKLIELAQAGTSKRELTSQFDVSASQMKSFDLYCSFKDPEFKKRNVIWMYGDTGTGKTTKALNDYKDIYWKNCTKWWDGFDNHETVVLDEFRPGKYWNIGRLLRILGGTPERIETKGSSQWLQCKNIVTTTPYSPEVTFKEYIGREDVNQLKRRITETIHLTKDLV